MMNESNTNAKEEEGDSEIYQILQNLQLRDLPILAMESTHLHEMAKQVFLENFSNLNIKICMQSGLDLYTIRLLKMFGQYLLRIELSIDTVDHPKKHMLNITYNMFKLLHETCNNKLQEFIFGDIDCRYCLISVDQFFDCEIEKLTFYRCHIVDRVLKCVRGCTSIEFLSTDCVNWDGIPTMPNLEEFIFGFSYQEPAYQRIFRIYQGIEHFIRRHQGLKRMTIRSIFGPNLTFDFSVISQLQQLEELSLHIISYTPNIYGLNSIVRMESVKALTLSGESDYINNLLEKWCAQEKLTSLTLLGILFDQTRFAAIAKFENLQTLSLTCSSEMGFHETKFKHLKALRQITTFYLRTRGPISVDTFLSLFKMFPKIKLIDLKTPLELTNTIYSLALTRCREADLCNVMVTHRNLSGHYAYIEEQENEFNKFILEFKESTDFDS